VDVQSEFWRRVTSEWLPAFCSARGYDPQGFRREAKTVSDGDAENFLQAIDHNVVSVDSGARFRMPQSKACEHIFWEHPESTAPRAITLWIEPIVTIAAVARLHLDCGWPRECLGMQSVKWEFDITAFKPPDLTNEYIAGEVKATTRELDKFLANLERCCIAGAHEVETNAAQSNAHKKWLGLTRCRAPIFWAVGPGGDSRVFNVIYRDNERIALIPTSNQDLLYLP
jgi:hypothetical protein